MTTNHRLTDKPTEFADIRAAHPHFPDFAWRIMLGYTPKRPVTRAMWEAIRPFTIATAAAMAPQTYDAARRLMTMTARFHGFTWACTGTVLTVEKVYTQYNIDRFLNQELRGRSPDHRWGVSRQLVKVGRELADADLVALAAPDGKPRPPFTTTQIASMHDWANSLTTPSKRQNAWGLLGLAGGAGLRAAEIVDALVGDVACAGDDVFVTVRGTHARTVPMRRTWGRVLLRSIEGRDADQPIFSGYRHIEYPPRVIQTFLTEHRATVRPTPSQLRTSWLMHHINNDVPFHILKQVSGIKNDQTLARYYAHARGRDAADYVGLLTGAVTR